MNKVTLIFLDVWRQCFAKFINNSSKGAQSHLMYTVAMVTHYVEKVTITCSPILIMHFFIIIIVVSTDKEWWCRSVKA